MELHDALQVLISLPIHQSIYNRYLEDENSINVPIYLSYLLWCCCVDYSDSCIGMIYNYRIWDVLGLSSTPLHLIEKTRIPIGAYSLLPNPGLSVAGVLL